MEYSEAVKYLFSNTLIWEDLKGVFLKIARGRIIYTVCYILFKKERVQTYE